MKMFYIYIVLVNSDNPCANHLLLSCSQISNVQVESAGKRSRKNNIFHGSSAESILGKVRLETLQRPFMVLWKMGKVINISLCIIKMFLIFILVLNFLIYSSDLTFCVILLRLEACMPIRRSLLPSKT